MLTVSVEAREYALPSGRDQARSANNATVADDHLNYCLTGFLHVPRWWMLQCTQASTSVLSSASRDSSSRIQIEQKSTSMLWHPKQKSRHQENKSRDQTDTQLTAPDTQLTHPSTHLTSPGTRPKQIAQNNRIYVFSRCFHSFLAANSGG